MPDTPDTPLEDLRRAEKRGKTLPPQLAHALKAVADIQAGVKEVCFMAGPTPSKWEADWKLAKSQS